MLKSTQPVLSTTAMVILVEIVTPASSVQQYGCRWPICFGESRLFQPIFTHSPRPFLIGISENTLLPIAAPV